MWNGRDNNRLKITRSFACGGSHQVRNGGRGNFSAAALKMCRHGSVLLGHRMFVCLSATSLVPVYDVCPTNRSYQLSLC